MANDYRHNDDDYDDDDDDDERIPKGICSVCIPCARRDNDDDDSGDDDGVDDDDDVRDCVTMFAVPDLD